MSGVCGIGQCGLLETAINLVARASYYPYFVSCGFVVSTISGIVKLQRQLHLFRRLQETRFQEDQGYDKFTCFRLSVPLYFVNCQPFSIDRWSNRWDEFAHRFGQCGLAAR
jgi:hypothetical protein